MELTEQFRPSHMAISPLKLFCHFLYLWLYLLATIPHMGRLLWIIYDFSWSFLNTWVNPDTKKEAMKFGRDFNMISY